MLVQLGLMNKGSDYHPKFHQRPGCPAVDKVHVGVWAELLVMYLNIHHHHGGAGWLREILLMFLHSLSAVWSRWGNKVYIWYTPER